MLAGVASSFAASWVVCLVSGGGFIYLMRLAAAFGHDLITNMILLLVTSPSVYD